MDPLGLLSLLGTGLAIKELFKKKSLKDHLEFNIEVKDVKMDNITPVINLRIEILNPSPGSITVNSIGGIANFEGSKVADIFTNQKVTINPRTKMGIVLPVRLSVVGVALSLLTGVKSKKKDLDIDITFFTTIGEVAYKQTIDLLPYWNIIRRK